MDVKAVIIWDINEQNAISAAKEIHEETGVLAKGVACDVSDRSEVANAAKITRYTKAHLHYCFNYKTLLFTDSILRKHFVESWLNPLSDIDHKNREGK